MTSNFDLLRLAVEAKSGGKNTVILDDLGQPSIMVRIPKFKLSEVGIGTSKEWHPMFIVNGNVVNEVFVGKYQAIVENNRAYSLPGRDPAVYLDKDRAHEVCVNKGTGWHLTSTAEYAGLSLWCKANGFWPRGNNYCGCDTAAKHEKGTESYDWLNPTDWNGMAHRFDGTSHHHTGRVLTGSGPTSWAHDGSSDGIYDLNGNVWEWASGMRLSEGEIQVIPDNNSAAGGNETATSTLWKAILPNGTLVAPGTAGTLKYDATGAGGSGAPKLSDTIASKGTGEVYAYTTLETMTAKAGMNVPNIVKALGLFPLDTTAGGHGGDGFWMRNNGERLPIRGGNWNADLRAGVCACTLNNPRSLADDNVGLRPAFVKL